MENGNNKSQQRKYGQHLKIQIFRGKIGYLNAVIKKI